MKGGRRPAAPNQQETSETLMAAALKILARRSCSEGELRERLIAKQPAGASWVDDCIGRLKELGYLNDELFAHNYASYRVAAKPLGRAKLARELARKKVSAGAIGDALDLVFAEDTEERLIERAVSRYIRAHGRPADRGGTRRLFDHLARRGFEYDLIMRKLRELKMETEEGLQ